MTQAIDCCTLKIDMWRAWENKIDSHDIFSLFADFNLEPPE
jgi:hypothetical protein